MENDLKKIKNERRPKIKMEDNLQKKWKMTSKNSEKQPKNILTKN
jgi:hypothetical protein